MRSLLTSDVAGVTADDDATAVLWAEQKRLETWWWRVIRLECLELAAFVKRPAVESGSGYSLVQSAALECLLEVLNIPIDMQASPEDSQALLAFFTNGPTDVQPLDLLSASDTTGNTTATRMITITRCLPTL